MTWHAATIVVLALAALLAMLRTVLHWRASPQSARTWRWLVLLLAQPLLGLLLYAMLYPPRPDAVPVDTLTVLTTGADGRAIAGQRDLGIVLALPGAPAVNGVERVPDLGSALRSYPQARRVRVLGEGLPARDRDAARHVDVEASLSPLPTGLVRLDVPTRIATGASFVVSGRVEGIEDGGVELLDPADRRIDAMPLDGEGGFSLQGVAFAPGAVEFGLRVLDADGATVGDHDVPVWIEDDAPPKVLLLAGAPNPETRALRRWVEEAGFDVDARVALGAGMQLGDAPAVLSAELLDTHDVLVIDARAWQELGDNGRARVMQSVDAGLGLLLRADMPLPAATLRSLRSHDFEIAGGTATSTYRLPAPRVGDETAIRARIGAGTVDAPIDIDDADADTELVRRAWRITGASALPISHDAQGESLGAWRTHGRGRVGVWTPLDTWRLPLLGRRDLHAALWSEAVAAVARVHPIDIASIRGGLHADGRIEVCQAAAAIETPDGTRVGLLPDPEADGCTAFWPAMAGWHRLHHGGHVQPFHVAAADAHPGLNASATRDATLLLASRPSTPMTTDATAVAPRGSPWPWFAMWLALAAALWWFERAKPGRRAASRQA